MGTMEWKRKHGRLHGAKYEGEWEDNKRSGHGEMTYGDGKFYTGKWENDKRHGKGTLTDKNGKVIHEGEWEDGKPRKASKWFK